MSWYCLVIIWVPLLSSWPISFCVHLGATKASSMNNFPASTVPSVLTYHPLSGVILARFEQFVAAHHCTKKIFFWSICLLFHYNQPPIIGTMPIRDIGELPYPHLLCWRPMKVNRSHSVRTNSIFAINSSTVSQNYFNGSHLSPNNTRTCHQLICVDFVTKCRS